MQHIIEKYLGHDKNGAHHYQTKCSIRVASPQKLSPPAPNTPLVVEVGDSGAVLCKACETAQYNISQPMGSFVNAASKSGFISAKPDGDAVGKESRVVVDGYGIDGELSSDDGLGGYEQVM